MSEENKARPDLSWEEIWKDLIKPGLYFDKEAPLPELLRTLGNRSFERGDRALVPGCGRGYDVEALSKSGLYEQVIGIDIASTAVKEANEYLSGRDLNGGYQVLEKDFFEDDLGIFDFVYDYTFFCAIPLSWREKWGRRMHDLIKVGGVLVTVMFPVGKARELGGPPHGVSVDDYAEVLSGFKPIDGPRVLDENSVHEGRGEGKTMWCVWRRTE